MKIQPNRFSTIAIIIMSVIFIMNLILSREDNLLWIILIGGGSIVDYLGESYITIFEDFQLYRLITYGYTQTAIFACLGMLVNWLIRKRNLLHEYKSQKGFYFLLNYLILSNLFGIGTLVIHLLGFAMGFLLGFVVKENDVVC